MHDSLTFKQKNNPTQVDMPLKSTHHSHIVEKQNVRLCVHVNGDIRSVNGERKDLYLIL